MLVKNFRPYLLRTFPALLSCYLSVVFLAVSSVQAAPPQTLDYQGYLADSSGVPLTGSQNLSISLYTTASGGSALWTQASALNLSNGRFTVVLDGSGTNSFPTGLFDQQLYVGLTVDSDPEMTPRQPLTSVPSAFEAINADTVDGMEANEIIDAASDEVRTPISNLPFTISESGSYYFTQNLTATATNGGNGLIDINVDDVTLDLMGFTLDGNGVDDHGIELTGRSDVVIKNGTVQNFGRLGIYAGGFVGRSNLVVDMRVNANGSLGVSGSFPAVLLNSKASRILRVTAIDNAGSGLVVDEAGSIKDCIVSDSGGADGIFGGIGSIIANNTVSDHQGAYGIRVGSDSTVANNVVRDSQSWGIYLGPSSQAHGNLVADSNLSTNDGRAAMRVSSDSSVTSNTIDNSRHSGIRVTGSDSVLRSNHITDVSNINGGGVADGYCIEFDSSDTVAIGNTATGCTTEFGGNVPPAARFVDNIGW